jgi:carbon starvation protein CstA
VPHTFLCRAVVVAILCAAVVAPAPAESIETAGKQITAGIIVVSAAVAVGVILLVIHYKGKKSSVTGCVISGASGMTLKDEKDQRTYALSDDTATVKPGDRMTLEGQRKKSGATFIFETQKVRRDFGACQP